LCFTGNTSDKKDFPTDRKSAVTNSDTNQNSNLIQKMDSSSNKFSDLNRNAFKLHYDAIVVDSHNDILMPIKLQNADITRDNPHTQSDFVKWKKGGLDVQVFSIYIPEKYKSYHYRYAMKLIDELENYSQSYSDNFCLATNYEELLKGLEWGKFCGLMGGEGGNMIEGSIEKLENLYNRGVRYLGLTWNTSNAIAVSARDESERGRIGGLTEFGKKVVEKMDELGMMIDVSHLGETAFWDVVNLSKNPIIASHSCVYNLCPHYRNLKDEQIQAIAKSEGIICVNFFCKFLAPSSSSNQVQIIHNKYKNDLKPIENEYGDDLIGFNDARYNYLKENCSENGTPVDILIDHIDYIVKLVGVDYVGLGSDFDGSVYTPNEIYDATCYPVITKKLVERGYKEEDIRKILGLNFLRVFKKVCG
jgi:membrane dipeptidase